MTGPELLPFAVDALLKTTLVLVAAVAVARLLRRRAAAWRHLAWTTALAGALVMPAVAWFAPEWTAPIDLPLPLRAAAPEMSTATAAPAFPAAAVGFFEPTEVLTVDKLPPLTAGTLAPAPAAAPRFQPATLLLAAWALGSALLLAWTLRSHLLAGALVRRAHPIRDAELEALLATTPSGERVRLVESGEIDVPLATGLLNPVLVVPLGFDAWSVERRRIVLLHELAHVERGDCLALAIARSAVALWWFHPIAWPALAALRREAEQAADDRVLEAGTRPSDYATHLLAVVQSLTGRGRATAGLSMAGSNVERRLLAMLDPTRSHRRLSPAALVLCTIAIAGGVVALGGLRADAAPSENDQVHADHSKGHDHGHGQGWFAGLAGNDQDGESFFGRMKKHLGHDEGARAFNEAMKRHDAGDYEASSEGFRRAYEEGHAKGTSAFNVGCALARLGREREAIDWLERAYDDGFSQYSILDTDEDLAYIRNSRRFGDFRDSVQERADERERLSIEKRQRELEGALQTLREPGYDEGAKAYRLGYEMHEVENWAGAEEAWRRAAELGYSPANAHYNVACALARQGHDSEALDWLEKAVALGFDDFSNLERDDDLASLHDRARFGELVETSTTLQAPGDINDLDEIRESQAEWRAFTKRTGELTRRHPDMGKAWLQHGMGLLRTGRHDEAAAAFRRAAETGQPEGLCLWNEACALAAAGRRDQAVDALGRSLDTGFGSGWQLANDPDLASLEGHSGFEQLKADHPAKGGERGIMQWLKMSGQGERQVY